MSSVNHYDFAYLKIPFENILTTTNNFDDENLVGVHEFVNYYKGQLLLSSELINILTERLNKEWFDGHQQFWTEVSLLSSLKHKNLVSFVGFCDDNDEKVIIYKHETRASLYNHLSDSMSLTWVRRLEISVGIAQALSYIHYDESRDFSVIHRNINSRSVYLNDVWEPKLGDFICSMKIKASERHRSFNTDKVWSTDGYTDPTYIETKRANHKSDIYSFGIVMFELLCGRKAIINDDQDNKYLTSMAITHYREKKLHEIIDWDLWNQMDSQSFDIFAEIAYDCLKEERLQRPNIDEIVPKLEKALKYARENKPIISLPSNEFSHLKLPLKSIRDATNNFKFEGELLWSGELTGITARRFNKDEWDDEKEQQFWMEISMLSTLKHKNVVSLVGFCYENDEKIIITKHETRGMLYTYLSDPMLLTWVRRLEICVGLAQALSYIHYDEPHDFSVIHRNINSAAVALNDEWEPKLCDFEGSIKIKAFQKHHSFHTNNLKYVDGYGDPTYIATNRVSHKSDMYSFGIVLFELMCGRESISRDADNKYLAPVAMFHNREKILDGIIDPDLWKQMNPRSLNIFAEIAYDCLNEERSQRPNIDDILTRLEKALKFQLECRNTEHSSLVDEVEVAGTSSGREEGLASYFTSTGVESNSSKKTMSSLKYLSHSQLSFEDIQSATYNFQNILKRKRFGRICQGRILDSGKFIDIVVRAINRKYQEDENTKFRMEKSILSSLNHTNLVSVIGYCDKNNHMITVYKKEAKGSLNKYLSDKNLTWMQRLKICLGIANALSYIHYNPGRDFSVIHCNIKSSKILLDDKWEPKLSGFEFSLKNTVARRHRLLLTRDVNENVYLDPKCKRTGGMTHKSDVYSFGVVLFDVLCGGSLVYEDELEDGLLSKLKKSHLDDMIDPLLREQMDTESLKIFSETAYWCIKEDRADRPYIDQVVKRLKKALEHQWKHENPVVKRTSPIQLKGNLEHLKIELNDIIEATKNFDDTYIIGSGGFGKVYRADLEHFDSSNSTLIKGVDKCDLPRKRSTVAIKRIKNQ